MAMGLAEYERLNQEMSTHSNGLTVKCDTLSKQCRTLSQQLSERDLALQSMQSQGLSEAKNWSVEKAQLEARLDKAQVGSVLKRRQSPIYLQALGAAAFSDGREISKSKFAET